MAGPIDRRKMLQLLAFPPGVALVTVVAFRLDEMLRQVGLDVLRQGKNCAPTGADVEGPFFISGAPKRVALARPDEPGDRLVIRGTVYGPDCKKPLPGTLLDVWQADAEGRYHEGAEDGYRLRGQLLTDTKGDYQFETIMPGRYLLGEGDAFRPAHLHFTIASPRHQSLTTQLYFKGDPYLAPKDACGRGCNSDDPGRIIELVKEQSGAARFAGTFDVILAASR
jgi:catechol 1,2-dioxygenase